MNRALDSTRSRDLQLGFLPAVLIEVARREPALEACAHPVPVLVEHGVPGGIPVAALHDQMLAENALECEPEPLGGGKFLVDFISYASFRPSYRKF